MAKSVMSNWSKEKLHRIVTLEPRPAQAILDDLLDLAKERPTATTLALIPTKRELQYYLSKNYSKVYISNLTNKPTKQNRPTSTVHYFKEE